MNTHRIVTYFIASVWMINGLFCKVLNLVPRHQEIVACILGDSQSRLLTLILGSAEILMALWVISGVKSGLNMLAQIVIIGTMNLLEFILAPDLLLWGRWNMLFAFLFIVVIWWNFHYKEKRLNAGLS